MCSPSESDLLAAARTLAQLVRAENPDAPLVEIARIHGYDVTDEDLAALARVADSL